MVRKLFFTICVVLAGCATLPKESLRLSDKGLTLEVAVKDSVVTMRDSVLFSFVLTNQTNDTVIIDSVRRVMLWHHDDSKSTMCDARFYWAYKGTGETVILPKRQLVMGIIVYISPDFFSYRRNELIAELICNDFYDEEKKEMIYAKKKIAVTSKPFVIKKIKY